MEFKSSNPPTNFGRIEDFAKIFGVSLPQGYRNFLLEHNGGRPVQGFFPIDKFTDPFGRIQVFFGLDTPVTTSDLFWQIQHRIVPFPAGLLEVACTGGGDLICIDANIEKAPVYFFDHRPSWGNGVWRESDLYAVAPSFSEFLSALLSEVPQV